MSINIRKKEILATEQKKRLKEVLGVTWDYELANMLGIKQQAISEWNKNKGVVPPHIIIKVAIATNTSMDWLYAGIGDKDKDYSNFKYKNHELFIIPGLREKLEGGG